MIEKILCFLVLIICLVYGLALLSWLVMKLDIEKRRSKRTKFFERMGENLLEIEKLIERLEAWNEQHLSVVCGNGHFACDYLCENEDCIVVRAATALEQLQAENDRLRRERDAAVKDISDLIDEVEEIRRGYGIDDSDADKALADMCGNYCENEGDGCYIEGEKYDCENFKWRGPQKEE